VGVAEGDQQAGGTQQKSRRLSHWFHA
jgi:hypothetical protein